MTRKRLEKRFEGIWPVPGTITFHHYVPLSESIIGVKRCSEDESYALKHNLLTKYVPVDITVSDYVACVYGNNWWIGIACEIDNENSDIFVKFMNPCGPAQSFYWPIKDETCWVPKAHVLTRGEIPITATGRQYNLKRQDFEKIEKCFIDIVKTL